jgi:hypothetical protein
METIPPSGRVNISKNSAAPPPSPPVLKTFPPIGVDKIAIAIGARAKRHPDPDSHLPTKFCFLAEIG